MRKCNHCGYEVEDGAKYCERCGCAINGGGSHTNNSYSGTSRSNSGGYATAVKVFLIIACVSSIWCYFIPLLWCLPMTIVYCKKKNNGEPISVGFKVCTLIFVSTIAGVLMLMDNDQ